MLCTLDEMDKMEIRVWLHILTDVTDTWGRLANVLSPRAPLPRLRPCIRLAAIVGVAIISSIKILLAAIVKGFTHFLGLGLFCTPLLQHTYILPNDRFPQWHKFGVKEHVIGGHADKRTADDYIVENRRGELYAYSSISGSDIKGKDKANNEAREELQVAEEMNPDMPNESHTAGSSSEKGEDRATDGNWRRS